LSKPKNSKQGDGDAKPDVTAYRETLPIVTLLERQGTTGRVYEVAIIQAGPSKNTGHSGSPRIYSVNALTEAVPLFDGARVYAYELARGFLDHKPEAVDKSLLRHLVGTLERPRMKVIEGAPTMVADFELIESAAWAREMLTDLRTSGKLDVVGLSIDARGREVPKIGEDGQSIDEVVEISAVESVDLVSSPAAGGRFLRLVASEGTNMKATIWKLAQAIAPESLKDLEESAAESDKILEAIAEVLADDAKVLELHEQENRPYTLREIMELRQALAAIKAGDVDKGVELIEKLLAAPSETVENEETEDVEESAPEKKRETAMPTKKSETVKETVGTSAADAKRIDALESELADSRVVSMVESTNLPKAIKSKLRESLTGTKASAATIQKSIKSELDAFEALVQEGVIKDRGNVKVDLVESGFDRVDRYRIAMLRLIAGDKCMTAEEKAANIPPFRSLREAYEEITGDREVRGRVNRDRVSTDYYAALREAVTTAGFPAILADTLNRRMVRDYEEMNFNWRKLVTVGRTADFRNQEIVRFGGYANMSIVGEGAAYPALATPTDEVATYAVEKRGGVETVTFETIKNDDVRFVQRIPTRIARASARTLEQHVMDKLINTTGAALNDDAIYDTTALYTVGHSNITTAALTWDSLWDGIEQMGKQTEKDSGEPLGVRPKFLVVPPELEQEARGIVESTDRPDTADRETNTLKGMVEVVVSHFLRPGLPNANRNWYLVADPTTSETIEVGFLDGREAPELLVQDTPTVDQVFTNDIISYRVRQVYDSAVLDFRNFFGSVL